MIDLKNKVLPFENQLKTSMSKTGSRGRTVDSIKNILFNSREKIYAALDAVEKQAEEIKSLKEINAALSQALAEADGKKSQKKARTSTVEDAAAAAEG